MNKGKMWIAARLYFFGSTFSLVIGSVFCLCEYPIEAPNGVIYSPNYPKLYENNTNCMWHIKSTPGATISLRIEDLDIEPDEPEVCGHKSQTRLCCKHNWLSVPVGGSVRVKSQQLCGSRPPPGLREIRIRASEVTLKMHISRIVKGGRGFRISFMTGILADCLVPGMVPCGPLASNSCYHNTTERCDGIIDCPGGQDEVGCQVSCASGVGSFLLSQKCDGNPDCDDYSDEVDCGFCEKGKALCSATSHHCFQPFLERCNGRFDCPRGEDEAGCVPGCGGRIACSSGEGCYAPWQHCDTLSDCSDGSDETQCPRELCSPLQDRRLCHNGRCLPAALWCDGNDDCGDNSDEFACLKNSVVALAIMGCLLCGLLLVVAVSCAFRIYGQRYHSPSNYHLHISPRLASHLRMSTSVSLPALMDDEFFLREPPPAYSVAVGQSEASPARPRRLRRQRPRPVPPPQVVAKPPDCPEASSSQSSPSRGSISSSSGTDDTLLLSS